MKTTLRSIRPRVADVLFVPTNVSVEADVEQLVAATVERFRRLDCAFNNAGIVRAAQLDTSAFNQVIAVDLRRVFLCLKHFSSVLTLLRTPRVKRLSWTAVR
jgi:NAD(P)-dependent dehydrogenase (short-subunit alcohol dehydrogenase family)